VALPLPEDKDAEEGPVRLLLTGRRLLLRPLLRLRRPKRPTVAPSGDGERERNETGDGDACRERRLLDDCAAVGVAVSVVVTAWRFSA